MGFVWYTGTPLNFNMEAENQVLEKEIPFGSHYFQFPCLNFGGVPSLKLTARP